MKYISDALEAPKVIGPYSQAVIANGLAFLSGQIAVDPGTGKLVAGGIDAQANQVLQNIRSLLTHLKLDFSHVSKTTIFLTDLANFQTVNSIYEKWLGPSRPARSTIQVSALPLGSLIEIEMTAALEK